MGKTNKKDVSFVSELISSTELQAQKKEVPKLPPKQARQKTRAALDIYSVEALEHLLDIMRFGSEKNRLKAAIKVIEYSIGKPSDRKESAEVIEDENITDVEFRELIDEDKEGTLQDIIEAVYEERRKTPPN